MKLTKEQVLPGSVETKQGGLFGKTGNKGTEQPDAPKRMLPWKRQTPADEPKQVEADQIPVDGVEAVESGSGASETEQMPAQLSETAEQPSFIPTRLPDPTESVEQVDVERIEQMDTATDTRLPDPTESVEQTDIEQTDIATGINSVKPVTDTNAKKSPFRKAAPLLIGVAALASVVGSTYGCLQALPHLRVTGQVTRGTAVSQHAPYLGLSDTEFTEAVRNRMSEAQLQEADQRELQDQLVTAKEEVAKAREDARKLEEELKQYQNQEQEIANLKAQLEAANARAEASK